MDVLVKVTIDGRESNVPPGSTVLTAAQQLGIAIPTFCHYAKLTPIGACRMCLVEIEKQRALQPACTTKVQEGMVVHTDTPEVVRTRKGVLEFLLTNHPLDCPVCDKGGECDLQDQVFKFGDGKTRFIEDKRHKHKALSLSPFILMDEERCVLCRRCARFMEEWSDDPELDLYERGARTVMSAFPGRGLESHYSGNLVEICPVGALTSRSFRFKARSWEMAKTPSVCSACGFGCNTELQSKARRLKRIVVRSNADVNDEWLCDKGRFADGFVHSTNRLTQPLVRRDGKLQPATWDEALSLVATRLGELAQAVTPDVIGGIGSARATCEANYSLQKLLRTSVGTNNVDFVGRPPEGAEPLSDLAAVHQADVVLLVGLDPATDAPMLDLWLRREGLARKVRVTAIAARRPESVRRGAWLPCRPGAEVAALNGVIHVVAGHPEHAGDRKMDYASAVAEYTPGEAAAHCGGSPAELTAVGEALAGAKHPVVLYGHGVIQGARGKGALAAIRNLAAVLGCPAGYVTATANALGASAMGVCPTRFPGGASIEDAKSRDSFGKRWGARLSPRGGLDLDGMLAAARGGKLQGLVVMGSDVATAVPGAAEVLRNLRFLVVLDLFLNATAAMADVVLPAASSAESDGILVSLANRVQLQRAAVPPPGQARPDWRILADLGARMESDEARHNRSDAWQCNCAEDVWRDAVRGVAEFRDMSYGAVGLAGKPRAAAPARPRFVAAAQPGFEASREYPLLLSVGRTFWDKGTVLSESVPALSAAGEAWLEMNPADATLASLKDGDAVRVASATGELTVRLAITAGVTPGCVWVARNLTETPVAQLLDRGGEPTRVRVTKA